MSYDYHKIRNPKFLKAFFKVTTSSALLCFFTLFVGATKKCEVSDSNGRTVSVMLTDNENENLKILKNDERLNIDVNDVVSLSKDKLGNLHYYINRGVTVKVDVDGKFLDVKSKPDVGVVKALGEVGVFVGEFDEVTFTLKTNEGISQFKKTGVQLVNDGSLVMKDGLELKIDRVTYNETKDCAPVDFEEEVIKDSNMLVGEEKVESAGQKGEVERIYKTKFVNGVAQGEPQKVGENLVKPPVKRVVRRGIRMLSDAQGSNYRSMSTDDIEVVDGRRGSVRRRAKSASSGRRGVVTGFATHYDSSAGRVTSRGHSVSKRYVAVDPKKIPYGSTVRVYNKNNKLIHTAIADDYCGRAVKVGDVAVDIYGMNIGKIPVRVEWEK